MLKFTFDKIKGDLLYFVLTDDGQVKGNATVKVNEIQSVTYADKLTETLYAEFAVRSLVFLLRDRCEEVKVAYFDERYLKLGFTVTDDGKMKARNKDIVFPSECCGC